MGPGDLIALGVQGILIIRALQKTAIPPIPSPLADITYVGLMGPRAASLQKTPSIDVTASTPPLLTTASPTAVSCISCTKHHLAGVAAMLNEATRFTRSGTPISDPEIQERLAIAEEEIAAWERKDVTPAQIAASPPEERGLILATVEKVRALRHFIDSSGLGMGKGSPEDLEKAAAMAGQIRQEFRSELPGLGEAESEAEPPSNPGHNPHG